MLGTCEPLVAGLESAGLPAAAHGQSQRPSAFACIRERRLASPSGIDGRLECANGGGVPKRFRWSLDAESARIPGAEERGLPSSPALHDVDIHADCDAHRHGLTVQERRLVAPVRDCSAPSFRQERPRFPCLDCFRRPHISHRPRFADRDVEDQDACMRMHATQIGQFRFPVTHSARRRRKVACGNTTLF